MAKGERLGRIGLLKSTDNMKTWQKMDNGIVASSPVVVVPHPTISGTVFTAGNVIQEKYCTRDGGKTWEPFSLSNAGNELKIDPHNPNHMIFVDELTRIIRVIRLRENLHSNLC